MNSKAIFLLISLSMLMSCSKEGDLSLLKPLNSSNESSAKSIVQDSSLEDLANQASNKETTLEFAKVLKGIVGDENSTSRNIESLSKLGNSILKISNLQKTKNLNDKEAYLKTILTSLSIPEGAIEIQDADNQFFVNSLMSYVGDLDDELTILQDLYLIRALQNLSNISFIEGEESGSDSFSFSKLNDYLAKKYKIDEKKNSDILIIYGASVTISEDQSYVTGLVRKILSREVLLPIQSNEVNYLLTQSITIVAGSFSKDKYGLEDNEKDIFITNLFNFSKNIADKLISKTQKQGIIDSLICLDSIFYFFEENLSSLETDKEKLMTLSDDYWFKNYRFISEKLIKVFPEIEKTNIALQIKTRSLLFKAIKFEKERIYPKLTGIFDSSDVVLTRSSESLNFKSVNLNNIIQNNYSKELAYGVYLHALASYLLTYDSVTDIEIKIRDIQDEYLKLNVVKNSTSQIREIDESNKLLTKGTFKENNLISNTNLIIHPLAYVKSEKLNLELQTVEGGFFDVSAEEASGVEKRELFQGTPPTQGGPSIDRTASAYRCGPFKTKICGSDKFLHHFWINEGRSPEKANKGLSGNKSGSIFAKIFFNDVKIKQPIFLANGGKGAEGEMGLASPLCSNGSYNELKFRSGKRESDGYWTNTETTSYSLFPVADFPAQVNNGMPGDGGDGGDGGDITIIKLNPVVTPKESNSKNPSKVGKDTVQIKILATVIGGSPGNTGRPNSCADRSGLKLEGVSGNHGNKGSIKNE